MPEVSKLMNVSLDAKGRCMYVITPKKHLECLKSLNDEYQYAFWHAVAQTLYILDDKQYRYNFINVNQGQYRNLKHLHLKIWIEADTFFQQQKNWSDAHIKTWKGLEDLYLKRLKPYKAVISSRPD
eukprot:UN28489